jgi:hypothetical protein
MTFKLDALFESPDKRYLDTNDLSVLSQYVSSIPERVSVYRTVRDQEVTIMQAVADTLQQQTNQPEALVERSIRNGLMVLRYVAMAMLLDDQGFIEERLRGWLPEIVKAYETQTIDRQLFQLLEQKLATVLTQPQLHLIKPMLAQAQAIMLDTRETVTSSMAGVR